MPARLTASWPARLATAIVRLPVITSREFRAITPSMPRFARGAAWFFIVVSLLQLGWVIAAKWNSPAGITTIYQTTVGEETYHAWGLAYEGLFGLLGAIAQMMIISAAVVMSSLGRGTMRRAGHGVLIAWAALWMVNVMRLAAIDPRIDSVLQAAMYSMLFVCTVARAATGGIRDSHRAHGAATSMTNDEPDERLFVTANAGAASLPQPALRLVHHAPRGGGFMAEPNPAAAALPGRPPSIDAALARTHFGACLERAKRIAISTWHVLARWACACARWLADAARRIAAACRAFVRALRRPEAEAPVRCDAPGTDAAKSAATKLQLFAKAAVRPARESAEWLRRSSSPRTRRMMDWLGSHGVIPQSSASDQGAARRSATSSTAA